MTIMRNDSVSSAPPLLRDTVGFWDVGPLSQYRTMTPGRNWQQRFGALVGMPATNLRNSKRSIGDDEKPAGGKVSTIQP